MKGQIDINPVFTENFNRYLNKWKKENNKTDQDFAKLVGVKNRKSVHGWKTGMTLPQKATMPKIASVLGVSERDLLTNETEVLRAYARGHRDGRDEVMRRLDKFLRKESS